MAADIFFTDTWAWSTSSAFFEDLMERARAKCRADEAPLVKIFSNAADLRCLGINLLKDRDLQMVVTERTLEAASDTLDELRADSKVSAGDLKTVSELVSMAQAHLRELGRHPT